MTALTQVQLAQFNVQHAEYENLFSDMKLAHEKLKNIKGIIENLKLIIPRLPNIKERNIQLLMDARAEEAIMLETSSDLARKVTTKMEELAEFGKTLPMPAETKKVLEQVVLQLQPVKRSLEEGH
jgi:hypothetical protein